MKTAVHLKGGTREDERDMVRMGKTQELRVRQSAIMEDLSEQR